MGHRFVIFQIKQQFSTEINVSFCFSKYKLAPKSPFRVPLTGAKISPQDAVDVQTPLLVTVSTINGEMVGEAVV